MVTVFGRTVLDGNQFERPCPIKIGGKDYARFDRKSWGSIARALKYVGATTREIKLVEWEFNKYGIG